MLIQHNNKKQFNSIKFMKIYTCFLLVAIVSVLFFDYWHINNMFNYLINGYQ